MHFIAPRQAAAACGLVHATLVTMVMHKNWCGVNYRDSGIWSITTQDLKMFASDDRSDKNRFN